MEESPDLEEFHSIIAQAHDALVETNFVDAVDNYSAALVIGRRLFSQDSPEVGNCLLGLGDACRGMENFSAAEASFQEAVEAFDRSEGEHINSRISARFRLAKILTVRKEYSRADECFADTVALAEPNLPLGNPLLTGIYEAYANMLAQGKLDSGTEREEYFREKARVCRGKFIPPKRPDRPVTRTDLPKLRRAEKPRASIFSSDGSNTGSAAKVWLTRLLLLVVLAAVILIVVSKAKLLPFS